MIDLRFFGFTLQHRIIVFLLHFAALLIHLIQEVLSYHSAYILEDGGFTVQLRMQYLLHLVLLEESLELVFEDVGEPALTISHASATLTTFDGIRSTDRSGSLR